MRQVLSGIILVLFYGCLVPFPACGNPRTEVFNIGDYGATGSGKQLDTQAIQRAVDEAGRRGGGVVYFPPGTYLSGTIFLKDNVTLHLESGATLLASTRRDDYPELAPDFRSFTDQTLQISLIYGENLRNVSITGGGVIDGQGAAYPEERYEERPYLLKFVSCRNVLVSGLTLRNAPTWVQHYLACDFLTIRGLRVISQVNWNNDMMDIDGCSNVHISDCYGDTGDDAITLKSTSGRICENVTITNCILYCSSHAIKFGTESNGGFKNITVSNIVISSAREKEDFHGRKRGKSGISLLMVDGGTLENVVISNITISGVMVPLFLRLGNRARPYMEGVPKPGMGAFRNVTISNIIATDVLGYGCAITGIPSYPIENVTLSNLNFTFPGGGTEENARAEVPELEGDYPVAMMFGNLPAWGFYSRHVDGLRFTNVVLSVAGADLRPAMLFDDVRGLDLDGIIENRAEPSDTPMLVLKDVRNAFIRGCRPDRETGKFMRIDGSSGSIAASGNDLRWVKDKFVFGEGVDHSVLIRAANVENPLSSPEGL